MRVVATAGHVDHGKSSLVLALTGTDPDRWAEEKRRGLTIDLGFAHTTLPNGEAISIVDVPGHVRFLRNMLAGVGAVDACVFVVAATEGWKPQSEEHLRILELLGLRTGVVALTKTDLVDDDWRELQILDVRDHLAGTFLANAPVVPVSVVTGSGLELLRTELGSLVERTAGAADHGRPRLWVDRSFAAKGAGTVVTGTLTGGSVSVDQHLDVGGREVRVRGVQSHGVALTECAPGNRLALNLAGVEHAEVARGDALIDPAQWHLTTRVDAEFTAIASLQHVVSRRGAYLAYIGSGEYPVRVRVLGRESIAPGATGAVRLHLATALPLVMGDRFVLRETGRDETVGGGEILDVQPMRPASKAHPDRSIDRIVAEHGFIGSSHLWRLTGEHREPIVGEWVVAPEALTAAIGAVRSRVEVAGDTGFDVSQLDDRGRAVLPLLTDITVQQGIARAAAAHDPWADHALAMTAKAGGFAPPDVAGADRNALRELVRRKVLVEREGIYWHTSAIDDAALATARLLATATDGFTMSEFREALGISRKFAVPLATELDARGVTRRRGDVRIGGPRLPAL